ncbi:hypothetical protein [Streptomyces sp. RK75]|uniref:hypothetical protein n=1 Tax=Streptomyces sp. RK75 TaxID=2824895 RepID=UPI001B36969C|nr:hypothetical protein [Streptomyces sp. RK75]MBQ0865867.1 hypothetical protein [Streptomyces sp. RK75]
MSKLVVTEPASGYATDTSRIPSLPELDGLTGELLGPRRLRLSEPPRLPVPADIVCPDGLTDARRHVEGAGFRTQGRYSA